jgi:hypothetical protein
MVDSPGIPLTGAAYRYEGDDAAAKRMHNIIGRKFCFHSCVSSIFYRNRPKPSHAIIHQLHDPNEPMQ